MDKLLGIAADVAKALLPVAGDMAKLVLDAGVKLLGRLGKLGRSLLRGKRAKKAIRKGRKFLRITALVSGTVAALSCAALIMSHRK